MFDTILFDLDGTLTDPKIGITKCAQYALHSFGIDEPDLDRLEGFIGPPLQQSFMEYYGFDSEQANAAIAKYRERFSTVGLFENSVFPGIIDLLAHLKRSGKTLAVATSKPEVFMRQILERYGLASFFDLAIGSEIDGARVDKAEVIEEVLKRLDLNGTDLAKVVMVGDRKYDIIGAKACGISAIGVRYGYAVENELESAGADYLFSTVDELKDFL